MHISIYINLVKYISNTNFQTFAYHLVAYLFYQVPKNIHYYH